LNRPIIHFCEAFAQLSLAFAGRALPSLSPSEAFYKRVLKVFLFIDMKRSGRLLWSIIGIPIHQPGLWDGIWGGYIFPFLDAKTYDGMVKIVAIDVHSIRIYIPNYSIPIDMV